MRNLAQDAEDAISALYSDMTVSQSVTKERMYELQEFIQGLIEGLDE